MRLILAVAALAALLVPTAAQAQTEAVSARADRVDVVIYRDGAVDTRQLMALDRSPWLRREGLAMIVETRTIDLPVGDAVLRFHNVADGIVTASAVLDGLPGGVVERNTDFDLLSPGSLMDKSIGETVRVVRTNPETGEQIDQAAVVRSGAGGVVLEIDGRFEALRCSGGPERVIFDHVPEGLSDQPILSVRTRGGRAGRYQVTLAYLATGLKWSADYVARLTPGAETLDLTGWLTLANFGSTTFGDAPVQVVAGDLSRDARTRPQDPRILPLSAGCWPMDTTTDVPAIELSEESAGSGRGPAMMAPPPPPPPPPSAPPPPPPPSESDLGDYKLYTLAEPVTVAARQTKQIQFLNNPGVAFNRIHRFSLDAAQQRLAETPVRPQVVYELRNEAASGLGRALPGGNVVILEQVGDRQTFAGQTAFDDRAIGLPVEFALGRAMDLAVTPRMVAWRAGSRPEGGEATATEATIEVEIANAKAQAAVVEVFDRASARRGFTIVSESQAVERNASGRQVWRVSVPAGATRTLRYTVRFEG